MYKIVKKQILAPNITRFSVEAPEVARSRKPGQFVVIRADETSERVPLTIVDSDPEKGTIDLIIQQAGFSTTCLVCFEVGDGFLDVLGPLGRPTDMEKVGTVVCVGGGVGTAVLYPIVKGLKEAGNTVITINGARNKDLLILEDELGAVSDELIITTDDGSWFFIGHSLESTFFPLEIAHEHRNHFPSIGLIIAAFSCLYLTPLNSKKIIAGIMLATFVLGATTWLRSTQWASYQRLAYFEAEHSPNSHAIQALLSNAAHKVGDIKTATQAIKRAMELSPIETAYALHYQNILAISGQVISNELQQQTLERLQTNIITPSTELALDQIAGCLPKPGCSSLKNNYIEWIETIILKKPNTAYYRFLQGKAYRALGNEVAALNAYQRAHDLDDKYLHPLFEMADILLRSGQFETVETVIGWIQIANEKTAFKRDKEIGQLKSALLAQKQQANRKKLK